MQHTQDLMLDSESLKCLTLDEGYSSPHCAFLHSPHIQTHAQMTCVLALFLIINEWHSDVTLWREREMFHCRPFSLDMTAAGGQRGSLSSLSSLFKILKCVCVCVCAHVWGLLWSPEWWHSETFEANLAVPCQANTLTLSWHFPPAGSYSPASLAFCVRMYHVYLCVCEISISLSASQIQKKASAVH